MCEWLASREWCDVQLQCGGRSFSAHRAVLASVSAFLRQILLACPHEETTTFIVLPDFDLDAMSSVLYYIYNGEVIIQKHKLDTFLDIIRTMQIFIDEKYLPEAYSTGNVESQYTGVKDKLQAKSNEIFSLEICGDTDYINIKKSSEVRDLKQPCSVNNMVQRDRQVRHHGLAYLDDKQPQSRDRQKSSFLRDLYIETYPRNGNVNGRSAGVLAISNECYREPTSVLLTNANGKYHSVDGSPDISKKSTDLPFWYSGMGNQKETSCTQNIYSYDDINLKNFSSMHLNAKLQIDSLTSSNNLLPNYFSLPTQMLPIGLTEINYKNFREFQVNTLLSAEHRNLHRRDFKVSTNGNKTAKGAILNQVLESPWSPRLPINYRPMHRKKEVKGSTSSKKIEHEMDTLNDSNNNIKTPQNIDVRERVTANGDAVEQSNPLLVNIGIVGGSDFKCTICNQVFTSNETLASHMKRHTSTARYSCTECGKSFSQLRNFKYHMSIHRGTREFAATCTVCGKYFNDRGYLSSHMKIHRNRKEYKCSQCPKSFNQRVAYNMHVRIHTGVKPHVCGECGKAFSRKMLLKQHQRTHSGERPYACPHCDKRFADRSNMTLHLRLHTGVKPFSCSLCPKSFTKKHHLKSHLNFHTGAKPYSCPRCNLAFTQSSNMRTHLKKCSAAEPITHEPSPSN